MKSLPSFNSIAFLCRRVGELKAQHVGLAQFRADRHLELLKRRTVVELGVQPQRRELFGQKIGRFVETRCAYAASLERTSSRETAWYRRAAFRPMPWPRLRRPTPSARGQPQHTEQQSDCEGERRARGHQKHQDIRPLLRSTMDSGHEDFDLAERLRKGPAPNPQRRRLRSLRGGGKTIGCTQASTQSGTAPAGNRSRFGRRYLKKFSVVARTSSSCRHHACTAIAWHGCSGQKIAFDTPALRRYAPDPHGTLLPCKDRRAVASPGTTGAWAVTFERRGGQWLLAAATKKCGFPPNYLPAHRHGATPWSLAIAC